MILSFEVDLQLTEWSGQYFSAVVSVISLMWIFAAKSTIFCCHDGDILHVRFGDL